MYSWMPWRNGTNFLGEKSSSQIPCLMKQHQVPQGKHFDCFPIIIFKKTTYDKDNISYEI